MRCFHLTVAYDGTDFFGWQWQPDRRTVQGALEEAIQRVTSEKLRVAGSGRTDAGVHAYGQAVSFTSSTRLEADVLLRALNANLSHDVRVVNVTEASSDFCAMRTSTGKRYRYLIYNAPIPDVFSRQRVWFVYDHLDVDAMRDAARRLVGRHDFKSYETSGSPRVGTCRTIRDLTVSRGPHGIDQNRIMIEVEADGFLYNMVRNLVGTLVEVGKGKQSVEWPEEILAARDRRLAGPTAPPQGLYLLQVFFPSPTH
ncbi:MAG: tRNA pseudouridine(38-40) synthase TruA [Pirellulaceae bacterium]|jgi:tRNA pseudouridine38-40 synthase|nr:tRNA pseudouridine(38-40) synthase TruA [Pirellulaceae bacterium]MDP6554659.1 tRNA pseudouridine(38-40) synthase TruA [Pirellulaceae bacterium]